MEAGYSQLGAASWQGRPVFPPAPADQRIFVGAGAGAAIAAAFDAPLAGAFYAFELIIGGYSVRALAPVAAATLAATLVERAIVHPTALFFVGAVPGHTVVVLPDVRPAGRGGGRLQRARHAVGDLGRAAAAPAAVPQWLRPAIGGALVAAMALVVPQVLGSGHGAIQELFDRDLGLVSCWCCW